MSYMSPVGMWVSPVAPDPDDFDNPFSTLWMDTSIANNAVLKYWDGDEYVRMDGIVDNGRVEGR